MGLMSWMFGGEPDVDPNAAKLQSADYLRDQTMQGLMNTQNRQAPRARDTTVGNVHTGQAAQLDPSQQAQFRGQQMGLANRLNAVAAGQQAGAGELAAQRQGQRAAANQMAMQRASRGANAGAAALTAAQNVGDIGLATQGQAQQAAMQDQQLANQTLGSLLQGARSQDIGMASENAQLGQQMNLANLNAQNQRVFQQAGLDQATSLANMQARLQTMGMNDAAAQAYLAQLFNVDAAEMQARLQQDQMRIAGKSSGVFGDLLQAGGTMGAAYLGRPGG